MFLNKHKQIISLVLPLIFSILILGVSQGVAQADLYSTAASAFDRCGTTSQQQTTVNVTKLPAGTVYIKAQKSDNNLASSVFVKNEVGQTCQALQSAVANNQAWTPIGEIPAATAGGKAEIIVNSNAVNLDNSYANIVDLLIAPSSTCVASQLSCTAVYQGLNVAVIPKIITGNTDRFSVQTVEPIAGVPIKDVAYFDDGQFMYRQPTIAPVDHNYLRGDSNPVSKVVTLKNGQQFTIGEAVVMPSDPLYSQYLTSTFYRLSSQLKIVVGVVAVAIVGSALFGLVRYIYRRHLSTLHHGFGRRK